MKHARTISLRLALAAVLSGSIIGAPNSKAQTAAPAQSPSGVQIIAVTGGEVDLQWSAAAGDYVIWRNGVIIDTVPASAGNYQDHSVQPGRKYAYGIQPASGGSQATAEATTPVEPDEPDTTAPTKPDDFTANPRPGYVLLDWYASHDNTDVTAYLIRRNGERITLLHGGVLDWRDTTVQPGVEYTYSVEAIDASGNHSAAATSAPASALPKHDLFLPLAQTGSGSGAAGAFGDAGVTAAQFAPQLRRYPYLTDLVEGNVAINWATNNSATVGSVTYGRVGAESCTANTVSATKKTISVNAVTTYQWQAQLSLLPNTQYCYRVFLGTGNATDLLGGDTSPTFWTQVPAGDNTPYSFVVVGDWGDVTNASAEQASLMSLIAQSGARFAVTTGDNAYPSGSQSNYGDLWQSGGTLSGVFAPQFWALPGRSMAMFPALGNHGMTNSDTNHPHLLNWPQSIAVQLSSGRYVRDSYGGIDGTTTTNYPSPWYAFDAGNVRYYVLKAAWADTNTGTAGSVYQVDYDYHWAPGRPEYQWLAADLAAHASTPKIAIFHYPLYSDNKSEKSDLNLRGANSLEGLLASNNVKLIFNGHAHLYQRSIAGGMTSYVVGATGVKLQSPDNGCAATTAYGLGWSNTNSKGYGCGSALVPTSKQQVYSFVKVSVNGSTVIVSPMNAQGQVFDQQVYDFGSGSGGDTWVPSTPTGLNATASSATNVNLAWSASTDNIGVTGYDIERDGALLTSVGAVTNYADATVSASTAYQYRVRARDAAGNVSGWSAIANVTTPTDGGDTEAPSTPAGLGATASSATNVNLTWSASSDNVGVTGYDIERDGALLTSVGAVTNYADATVTASTAYQYRVRARDAAGNVSGWSAIANVTTPAGGVPVFQDGFESGSLSAWTSSGGLTVQSANVHGDGFAVQGTGSATGHYAKKTLPATYTDGYGRVWFNIVSFASQVNILRFRAADDTAIGYVFVNTAGKLAMKSDASGVTVTSAASVGSGWHSLELRMTINGAAGATEVWLDAVRINDLSVTANLGVTPIGKLQIGEVQSGRTYDLLLDDAIFDTQRVGP